MATTTETIHCQCGETSGVRCAWEGARAETVVIEWMPEALRESHRAADNAGTYPQNGSVRLRVHQDCACRVIAAEHADDPEWAERWVRVVHGGPILDEGDWVAGGTGEDADVGHVVATDATRATIAWSGGTRTTVSRLGHGLSVWQDRASAEARYAELRGDG